MELHGNQLTELISAERIQNRIDTLGEEISEKFKENKIGDSPGGLLHRQGCRQGNDR